MIYFCFFFLEKDEHAFHFNSLLHHLRSENFLSKYFSLNSLECSLSFPYFSNYSSCKFEIACFPANSYLLLSTLINSSCHILCIFVLIYINVNAAISKMGSRLTFQLLFNLPIHEFGEHGGVWHVCGCWCTHICSKGEIFTNWYSSRSGNWNFLRRGDVWTQCAMNEEK